MSNRAERRAAERAAHKAANKAAAKAVNAPTSTPTTSTTAQSVITEQHMAAAATFTNFPSHLDFTSNNPKDNNNMTENNPSTQPETAEPELTDITEESSAEKLARIRSGYAKLPSEAQINANRENAQKSTGAKPPEGKTAVSQNRRTHGLIGQFAVMSNENMTDFLTLKEDVIREYQPGTSSTEWRLVQTLIQHYWLMLRAVRLQDEALIKNPKMLPLYMRYQATHERSYYRAQKELQKLVKERAQQQIGFERQNTKEEAHQARIRLQHAKAESIETDTCCKKVMGVPIPGIENVPFKELAEACSLAITGLVYGKNRRNAAA